MDGLIICAALIFAAYLLQRVQISEAKLQHERAVNDQKQMLLFMEYMAEQRREAEFKRAAALNEQEQKIREKLDREIRKKRTVVTEDGDIVELDKLELMI